VAVKVPKVRTGDVYLDFWWIFIWFTLRDYIYGTYEEHKSARIFLTSEKPEFFGKHSDWYFEAVGLDKRECYLIAHSLRKDYYQDNREPAFMYKCNETCTNGLPCGKEFGSLESYRRHLDTYNHSRPLCARDGCVNLAKIKYCSGKCAKADRQGRIKRYPVEG
jgi:hypothetical protein